MPDKETQTQPPDESSETGLMPRVEMEPQLNLEPPMPPTLPEVTEDFVSSTGKMPVVNEESHDNVDQDRDTPDGSR